jgi:hypothetical protein
VTRRPVPERPVRERSWVEIRWRQFRNAPRPVVRAVASSLVVAVVGTIVTYLIVPQPTGSGERRTRTAWSAALGFFAAVPIAYLVLVVESQVLKPLLV